MEQNSLEETEESEYGRQVKKRRITKQQISRIKIGEKFIFIVSFILSSSPLLKYDIYNLNICRIREKK